MPLFDETDENDFVLPKSYSTQGPYEEINATERERRTSTDVRIQSSEHSRPPLTQILTKWRKWQIIISLVYANFWVGASVSLQGPFFPLEAESKGATPTEYGFVFGIFELTVLITSPILGKLISKISPKCILPFGLFLCGAACCSFGLLDYIPAGKTYISMAFVVRIFEGIGAAAQMVAAFVIVTSTFPENVATSFSVVHTSFGFGLTVGPTLGGALYEVGGFVVPFVVNGSFLLIGSIVLFFILRRIDDSQRQEREGSRSILKFLADLGVITFSFSILSSFLFIGFNCATLEPHLRQFDLTPVVLGAVFMIFGGTYAITTIIFGRIVDKGADPLTMCMIGYTLSCLGILLVGPVSFIPFKPTVGTVIASLILTGLGLASKVVSSFVGSMRNAGERGYPDNLDTYGMVSGLVSSCISMGAFFGPTIGGIMLDNMGYRSGTVFIFSLEVIFTFILVIHMVIRCVKRRNSLKDPTETEPLIRESLTGSHSYSVF